MPRLARSRAWLERSLEAIPGSQRSLWFLAEVYYRQREFRAAERIYLDLATQDPRFHEGSRISLGRIALLTRRYDLADRYFDEAMARQSDQVAAILGKSVAAEGRGDRKRMAELHAGLAAAEGYLHQASLRGYEVTDAQRAALLPR